MKNTHLKLILLFRALGLPSLLGWTNSSTGINIRLAWDKINFEEWNERFGFMWCKFCNLRMFWNPFECSNLKSSFFTREYLKFSQKFFLNLYTSILLRQESIKVLYVSHKSILRKRMQLDRLKRSEKFSLEE